MEKKKAYVVANAHLDTVWRWTLSKTIKEFIPDTLSKNFEMLEKYPNYRFNFEGAYRYELIEKFYPLAFEKIKELVAQDRWCISGTAYENGDTNIPSPEALIRNILLGDKYFKEHFGKSSKDLFLPDCFGFSWVLPSVAAHCGLKGFTTQKLSWGSAYGIPFDIGIFKGPDGNSIYTSLNAKSYRYKFTGDIRADISIIDRIADNAKNASLPWANHLYGTGDQGGAPTEESVIALEQSIAKNEESDFEVISAKSDDIFLDIDKLSQEEKSALPVWDTELLMTSHGAGGYTSRAMSKRLNKQCERAADFTEKACVMAYSLGSHQYPKKILEKAWKRVVRHQFHDDITGTSVMEAYNKAWEDYFLSLTQFKTEYTAAAKLIHRQLDTSWIDDDSKLILANNPTQYTRKCNIEIKLKPSRATTFIEIYDKDNNKYPCQIVSRLGRYMVVLFQAEIEGFGYKAFGIKNVSKPCEIETDVKVTNHSLENSKYKIILNKNGDIAYLYDKKLGRQIIKSPIKMALMRDVGSLAYPSWEIRKEDLDREPYCYANTPKFSIIEDGPVRVSIKVKREAEYSEITQVISLTAGGETVDIKNTVNWKTRRTMLKAVFPFTAHNENATYDLGLGVIKRGTNTETLHEVPAQKWADITDESNEFGVSVFSECKHGWDKPDGNTLRLTCIHTPAGAFTKETRQDLQDLGRNIFSFSIYSHEGGFENGTQKQAEIFANPCLGVVSNDKTEGTMDTDRISFAKINNDDVIVRAIKQCEYDDSVIIRVNEANGKNQDDVTLKLFKEIGEAELVNGVEETIKEINVTNGDEIKFSMKPFEVKTFKITFAEEPPRLKKDRYIALDLNYNARGFTADDDMRNVILQGSGLSLPLEELDDIHYIGGIRFNTIKTKFGAKDCVVCNGQEIKINSNFTKVYFIAGSTIDSQEIVFRCDKGPHKLVKVLPITPPQSKWDMKGLDQSGRVDFTTSLAIEFEHTHHPEGNIPQNAKFYLYEFAVTKATRIILPKNSKIVILAMTAVKEHSSTKFAGVLEDLISTDAEFEKDIPPIDKITDKADFLTIRAGKIQDQINGGKGKGIKRDNIITNIIRSYTKSEW